MKTFIFCLLFMASCTCNSTPSHKLLGQGRKIDTDLEPIVKLFEKDLNVKVDYEVGFFTATKASQMAACDARTDGTKYVHVDRRYFDVMTDAQREQILFHELGHCSLGAAHTDGIITFSDEKGKWPKSLMRGQNFTNEEAEVYFSHRMYYINEMKQGVNKK